MNDEFIMNSPTSYDQSEMGTQICSFDSYIEKTCEPPEGTGEQPSSPPLASDCCSSPPAASAASQQSPSSEDSLVGCSESLPQNSGGSVARRNERERKRVRMVNMGFAKLRQYVPLATRGKRLSKVETLRSAIDYIRQLRQLLIYHQQCVEESVPDYYYLYDPHTHHQRLNALPFGIPRHNTALFYDGITPPYAGDTGNSAGCCHSMCSANSESPSSYCSNSEVISPPSSNLLPEEQHVACWAV